MEYQVHEAFLLVPPEEWRGFHGDTAHPEGVFLFRQTIKMKMELISSYKNVNKCVIQSAPL